MLFYQQNARLGGSQVQEHLRLRQTDSGERGSESFLQGNHPEDVARVPGRGHHLHDLRQLHGDVQQALALKGPQGSTSLLGMQLIQKLRSCQATMVAKIGSNINGKNLITVMVVKI